MAVTLAGAPSPRPGRAVLLTARHISPEIVESWRGLVERAAEPNPFAEPELVLPALRHLAGGGRAGILTAREGGRLTGLLPVRWPVMAPLPAGRRLPVPLLQAWVEPFQPLSTPLLDRDEPVRAMAALLRPTASLPSPLLLLRYFPEHGPVAAALDAATAERGRPAVRLKTYERALWEREGGPPPSRNRRNRYNRLRRQREAMAAALGPVAVVDRSDDPAAIEEFLALEASGWKGREGTAIASQEAHAAWFRETCDGLRSAGRLEVLAVEAGGRTTAMWVDFDAGDGSLHLKSAYDETLGDHRPGEQLLLHCIDEGSDSRYAWRDSATVPDNTLFNQLWSSRRTLSTVVVPLHGRAGDAALAAVRAAERLRGRGRAD